VASGIAAALLAGYLALALYGLFSPSRHSQHVKDYGFALFVAAILASIGALLLWGVRRGRRGVVRFVLILMLLPALNLLAGGSFLHDFLVYLVYGPPQD